MYRKPSVLKKVICVLCFSLCMLITSFAVENQIPRQTPTVLVDGTIYSNDDVIKVLSKDLGGTARLNVYVYGYSNSSPAEIRLFNGSFTSTSDYSELLPIATYELKTQTAAGFLLTKENLCGSVIFKV